MFIHNGKINFSWLVITRFEMDPNIKDNLYWSVFVIERGSEGGVFGVENFPYCFKLHIVFI